MKINNDVLSIINSYSDIKIVLKRNKFIIPHQKCRGCNNKIRYTKKSLADVYLFPEVLEIDKSFIHQSKYIKKKNILFFHENKYYTYYEAIDNKLIDYRFENHSDGNVYGRHLTIMNSEIKVYAKRIYSIHNVFYEHIVRYYRLDDLIKFFKKNKGNENKIMKTIRPILKEINIVDIPYISKENLCSICRKRIRKGYIFI